MYRMKWQASNMQACTNTCRCILGLLCLMGEAWPEVKSPLAATHTT